MDEASPLGMVEAATALPMTTENDTSKNKNVQHSDKSPSGHLMHYVKDKTPNNRLQCSE